MIRPIIYHRWDLLPILLNWSRLVYQLDQVSADDRELYTTSAMISHLHRRNRVIHVSYGMEGVDIVETV